MINDTLFMMLMVGLVISFAVLGFFIWGARSGQFDDSEKMMGGLLFDTEDDLNDAVKKDEKKKDIKRNKKSESQK